MGVPFHVYAFNSLIGGLDGDLDVFVVNGHIYHADIAIGGDANICANVLSLRTDRQPADNIRKHDPGAGGYCAGTGQGKAEHRQGRQESRLTG